MFFTNLNKIEKTFFLFERVDRFCERCTCFIARKTFLVFPIFYFMARARRIARLRDSRGRFIRARPSSPRYIELVNQDSPRSFPETQPANYSSSIRRINKFQRFARVASRFVPAFALGYGAYLAGSWIAKRIRARRARNRRVVHRVSYGLSSRFAVRKPLPWL